MDRTVQELKDIMINYTSEDVMKDEFLEWLERVGYFKAPAAKGHHGACKCGLFEHSLAVAIALEDLTYNMGLTWERPESPSIIGFLHDICKTDDYVYDFETNSIEGNGIAYNKHQIMSGHGDKSVIMLAGHFALTEEEAMCIRFHMGAFTEKEEWQYYSSAVKKFPNVLWTHTADMVASQIKGI